MNQYVVKFATFYNGNGHVIPPDQTITAGSFKIVQFGVCFFDDDGHAISYYSNILSVHQLKGQT